MCAFVPAKGALSNSIAKLSRSPPCASHGATLCSAFRMIRLCPATALLLLCGVALATEPDDSSYRLKRIRKNHKVPALAVAAVVDGDIVSLGAQGRRRITEKEARVTRDDHWHLGSCTKSMTASVPAML